MLTTAPSPELARLTGLVRDARSVVALTGAGISVPSGIPDFRSPQTGLWEKVDPMEVAHIDAFIRDPVRFWGFYAQRFTTLQDKRPNGAHRVLVAMERAGLLDGVITQNVDTLHRKAGTEELVEVHGSVATCSCSACAQGEELVSVRARLPDYADGVPRCRAGGAASTARAPARPQAPAAPARRRHAGARRRAGRAAWDPASRSPRRRRRRG